MDKLTFTYLEQALSLLGERLTLDAGESHELVVCGGSSLIALGYVSRVTRDVDVVARRLNRKDFISSRPLPAALLKAASRVAADMGLPSGWLNDGPADLFERGMPAGFSERLKDRPYGSHLTIWFIDRFDQIHFKLYAAADQGPGQHLDDLLALRPTPVELLTASRWAFTHDVSPAFRLVVCDMLKQLGHARVAEQL